MKFNVKMGLSEKQRTDCLILGVFEGKTFTHSLDRVDAASDGYVSKLVKSGDITGQFGKMVLLPEVPGIAATRVLVVGCGKKGNLDAGQYQDLLKKVQRRLQDTGAKTVGCYLHEVTVAKHPVAWHVKQAVLAMHAASYQFNTFKSKKPSTKPILHEVTFFLPNRRELEATTTALEQGVAIAQGVAYTRDLGNTPPNVCHPSFLAKEAAKVAKKYKKISAAVLDLKDLRALKMGALLAVGQGSAQTPKLITLAYRGTKASQKPYVFVGKGITFDTGGNSLKPAAAMVGMKYDMCGAATVLGVMKAVAELSLPINVVGVIASAENMPGGTAIRPDDVITSLSGKTIEVLNTDAEGRLVLCDALTYCERFQPEAIIDIATLTGACVVALGRHLSAVYSNTDSLAQALLEAGCDIHDRGWHMPLGREYQKQLDSNIADVANIGGPEAGSVTAACFLARFTEKMKWAHLDVAGSAAQMTGTDRDASGRPVSMLVQYLINQTTS